jgi:hypothetical protein
MRSRVELFESIRRDARLEGMGVRALARKHRVHRRTVRQALVSAVPPERKVAERRCSVLDAWKPLIQAWVTTDERLPKKQRHTAHRIWQRLVRSTAPSWASRPCASTSPGCAASWAAGSAR